jgi:Glucosidase II beta subunit-like protein
VDLECGAENEVIKVTEPSKCEYLVKMRSPVVCTKPDGKVPKEEL